MACIPFQLSGVEWGAGGGGGGGCRNFGKVFAGGGVRNFYFGEGRGSRNSEGKFNVILFRCIRNTH